VITRLLIFAAVWTLPLTAQAAQQPNILWIIFEDMSPDLSCYGNQAVSTPNIDNLASRGMRFNHVHTTGPACSPSRTALATGVFQTTLGAYHMRYSAALRPELPAPIKILPELMRDCGYHSGNIKKFPGLTTSGKDDWLFQTTQKSWDTKSWDTLISKKPFFGQVQFKESHRSFRHPTDQVKQDKIKLPPYYPDHPVARDDWTGYLADVMAADQYVGTILKELKTKGLDQNTIVIVFSDHGRPMPRGKNWLYDSGTHIPLVVYYPEGVAKPAKYKAGTINNDLISAIDLVAETVLMAGGNIPDWMQGRSFLRNDSTPREHLTTAVDRIGNIDSGSRAIRTKQFKYIRNHKTPASINECTTFYRRSKHPIYHLLNVMGERGLLTPEQEQMLEPMAKEELYDLSKDPYETVNLIGTPDYAEVHNELKIKLDSWIKQSKDKGLEKDSPEIVKHFHNYGVVNGKKLGKTIAEKRKAIEAHFNKEISMDLVSPIMTNDPPAAGKRVRQVAHEYKGTDVYHSLYLPTDWKPGGKYPLIVEYTGNKFPPGKGSGEVKDANLGFGMSGDQGFIWVAMPYVGKEGKQNAVTWWGDRQATIDYCKLNLPRICKQFGGDVDNVFICGFSRGAIGSSYIGLADDEIASLWKGMFTHDHFDGHRKWGYPESDRESAVVRLARLKGRPVLVSGMGSINVRDDFLKDHLDLARFTFLEVPTKTIYNIPEGKVYHPHTDMWMHRESKYRTQAREWLQAVLKEKRGN
jgi:uncharacterized sulfatase